MVDQSNGSGKKNSDSLSNHNIPNEPKEPVSVPVRLFRSNEIKSVDASELSIRSNGILS